MKDKIFGILRRNYFVLLLRSLNVDNGCAVKIPTCKAKEGVDGAPSATDDNEAGRHFGKQTCRYLVTGVIYTLNFVIIAFVLYGLSLCIGSDVTLINKVDGENQYLPALIYYSDHLKTILKELIFSHRLVLPEWEAALGEGADIMNTFSYYVIGSPLTLIAVFFNPSNMYICYMLIIMLRLYFAGIAFLLLCREKIEGLTCIQAVCGALLYVFGGWGIDNSLIWYNFLIPMIYFPLLILGVEKILNHKGSLWLIVAVAFCISSNFYFAYVCGVMAAGHTVLRLVLIHGKNIRSLFKQGITIFFAALLGFIISMINSLPAIYSYMNNPRVGAKQNISVFKDLDFFASFPKKMLNIEDEWGLTCVCFVAVILLFAAVKGHYLLKFYVVLAALMLGITIFGSILNGFSYSAERWTFAMPLLFSYILLITWDKLTEGINSGRKAVFLSCLCVFLLCVILYGSRDITVFLSMCMAFLLIMALTLKIIPVKFNGVAIYLCCLLCVGLNWMYRVSPDEGDETDSMVRSSSYSETLYNTESRAVEAVSAMDKAAGDTGFFRYSGRLRPNSGLFRRLSSTSFYWSNVSEYSWAFRKDIAALGNGIYMYSDYDDRTVANAVSAVKYYVSSDEKRVPCGFSFAGSLNVNEDVEAAQLQRLKNELGTDELSPRQENSIKSKTENYQYIYRNDNALPLGFTYDSYITYENYMEADAPIREWSMLSSAVIEGYGGDSVPEGKKGEIGKKIDCKINNISDEIFVQGNSYTATEGGGLDVEFESDETSETYLYIQGLQFEAIDDYERYFLDDDKYDPFHIYNRVNFEYLSKADQRGIFREHFIKDKYEREDASLKVETEDFGKQVKYYMPYSRLYGGQHDFVINLGYHEGSVNNAHITFEDPGIYTIENISVYCLNMEDYPQRIAKLKENVLENEDMDGDIITGTVSLDKPKFLYLSIPYARGWSAYDNEQSVRLYRANDMYMAMELTAGEHDIKLEYKTPYLRAGAAGSLAGLILLAGYLFCYWKNKKSHLITTDGF